MRSRLARVGVVAAGLLALLGTTTPPAHADTVFSAVFTGTATLNGALSYPCTGAGAPDVSLCPTGNLPNVLIDPATPPQLAIWQTLAHLLGQLISTLPLQDDPTGGLLHNFHIDFHHNQTGVSVSSTNCVGVGANVAKAPKPPVSVGLCGFAVAGTVAGHCGLSGGQVIGNFNDGSVLGPQDYTVDVHFNGIASVIVFTGHYRKASDPTNHGLLVGATLAIPVPTVTGTTLGNSCTQKTASVFQLVGAVAGVPNVTL